MSKRWRTIGEVCVDTGTIVICDPCQMDEASVWWSDREFVNELRNEKRAAQLKNDHGLPLAVALHTGFGDGRYKVEASYDGGRCAEIRIKFF